MSDEVTIIEGDCLDVLPTLEAVAAIVTDPPYGIRYSPGDGGSPWTGGVKTFAGADLIRGDDRPFDPAHLLAKDVPTILWGANHYADKLPPRASWLIWDKRDGSTSNDFADCEMAWMSSGSPARLFSHRWQGAFRDSERGVKRVHPTQKPVRLMIWCLKQLVLPAGSLVLDPYAGSGTTAVACLKAGLRCIVIEKDPRYIEVIRRRLRDAATPLFDRPP
jgi:site-specific DNA-methyltransferase (adenine-specific)